MNSYQKLKVKYDALLKDNASLKKEVGKPQIVDTVELDKLKEQILQLKSKVKDFQENFIHVDLIAPREEGNTKFEKLVNYIKREKENNIYLVNILKYIEKLG